MTAGNNDLRDNSVGELLRQLSQETTTLVKQELDLAKAEMSEKGRQAGVGAGVFGGAGVSGLLGLIFLSLAIVAAIDTATYAWVAALSVGGLWAVAAGGLGLEGRGEGQQGGTPAPGA